MNSYKTIHEQKYHLALANNFPGWGGEKRIQNIPKAIQRCLSEGILPIKGNLLELGAGAGNVSIEFAKRGYRVSGVEVSPTAVEWAKELATKASVNIDFRVGTVTDLSSFPKAFFDVIYDGNCLHCIVGEDRAAVFEGCFQLLKINGVFYISSLCQKVDAPSTSKIIYEEGQPYRYIADQEEIQSELKNAGFRILKTIVHSRRQYDHINIYAIK